MKTKIFINKGSSLYRDMFEAKGWEVVDVVEEADLVVFTGGPDVHPSYYGETVSLLTNPNQLRDTLDSEVYKKAVADGVPMVGICRGAQFLNVMQGGRLWQGVDGHSGGSHDVVDLPTGEVYRCSSTHHQMMRPHKSATIIGTADVSVTMMSKKGAVADIYLREAPVMDIEVVSYPESNILCFQPHPETAQGRYCQKYFFTLLERELEIT
jgi:gamma-glutamyl-gamma-aminobutyrate hydrolase PuuD